MAEMPAGGLVEAQGRVAAQQIELVEKRTEELDDAGIQCGSLAVGQGARRFRSARDTYTLSSVYPRTGCLHGGCPLVALAPHEGCEVGRGTGPKLNAVGREPRAQRR